MKSSLVSVDVGTMAIKAGVFSLEGEMLGMSYAEYPLLHPARWHVEQDASLWWDLTRQAIGQALDAADLGSDEVAALSISAQGISFVPVGTWGRPLNNAFSWLDTRAVDRAQRLNRLFPIAPKPSDGWVFMSSPPIPYPRSCG